MKHKDGLDIAALLLLLLVAIAAMVVPVALTQPALLAVPAVLVLIALCVVLYQRRRLRAFLARQLCSTDFENSRIQYSLANLPIPTVLVNDGRILWYNQYFRQDVLDDYDAVTRPVNRVLPELDLAVCSRPHGQDLKVGERIVFEDMIHYTMVKTTMFNGVHHPAIAVAHRDGRIEIVREFGYEDFRNRMS